MTARRRALARALATQPPQRHAITATVTATDPNRKMITVSPYQGAPPDTALTVPHLAHYSPTAGDTVLLVWVGGNALVAIGKLA